MTYELVMNLTKKKKHEICTGCLTPDQGKINLSRDPHD